MAAEVRESFGVEAELLPGGRGVFDVLLGDVKVFSKYEEHRFPEVGEVTQLIKDEGESWV